MKSTIRFWLATQCRQLSGVSLAVVLSQTTADAPGQVATVWPEGASVSDGVLSLAEKALTDKQCRLQKHSAANESTGEPQDQVTCPLKVDGKTVCSAVFVLARRPPKQQNELLRQLQSGIVWFEVLAGIESSLQNNQLVALVELIAAGLEHERFEQAALDIVTELAKKNQCDRVSVGFVKRNGMEVVALSTGARFDSKSDLIRAIGDAMLEAVDQAETVTTPPVSDEKHLLVHAHEQLQKKHHIESLCTIPLFSQGTVVGALLFERSGGKSFDPWFVEYCEQLAALMGPLLEMRRREERNILKRGSDSTKGLLARIFGPGYLVLKVSLALCLIVITLLSVVTGEYQVNAAAALEAESQRAVVALQKGYIASASVRAGDVVQQGDFLGALDDKDLKLEEQRFLGEHEQLRKEYRGALAQHDRTRTNILKTKIVQIQAQINLLREQLLRTRLLAPIDGLVVSGDLNQALGSPVKKGQVLFEIAPLGQYHVVLEVEEDDIRDIHVGQQGHLLLSSMVETPVAFTVTRITPVSVAGNGRNFFRVEADMEFKSDLLRPGMTGVAKVAVEERKLIWIWTHKAFNWMRIKLWALGL